MLTPVINQTDNFDTIGDGNMQDIQNLVSQIKAIMADSGVSQTALVNLLDGKCSRATILSILREDSDFRVSTLLLLLDVLGVDFHLQTEKSRQAILAGDIAAYRTETEQIRADLESVTSRRDYLQERYDELLDKNTSLINTVSKQQSQIDRFMERMEKAENALYAANEDARRKDAKISELLSKGVQW